MEPLSSAPRADQWFEGLFTEHATAVYRYLLRRLPQAARVETAEDLAADAFATAWRRRDDVPAGHELPWLIRTAGLLLANHQRKRKAVPLAVVPDVPDDVDPADLVIEDDAVRRALASLTPRDRQILLLAAWEGLRGEALADVLGISRGGADAALSRARSRFEQAHTEQTNTEQSQEQSDRLAG